MLITVSLSCPFTICYGCGGGVVAVVVAPVVDATTMSSLLLLRFLLVRWPLSGEADYAWNFFCPPPFFIDTCLCELTPKGGTAEGEVMHKGADLAQST